MARQAFALNTLVAEINAIAPERSKASDGGIGDDAHAARKSKHNPNASGVWTARDITHHPAGGMDCNGLANHLVSLIGVHPAMGPGSEVIWNRRIFTYKYRHLGWRAYSGSPHDKHLHVGVSDSSSGYDDRTAWGLYSPAPLPAHITDRKDRPMLYLAGKEAYCVYAHNGGWVAVKFGSEEYNNLRNAGVPAVWVEVQTLNNLIADGRGNANSDLLNAIRALTPVPDAVAKG